MRHQLLYVICLLVFGRHARLRSLSRMRRCGWFSERTARALSLVHKATGQECLVPGAGSPLLYTWRERSSPNPAVFPVRSLRREGDRLIATFEPLPTVATIRLRITGAYVAFLLETTRSDNLLKDRPARSIEMNEDTRPFDEICFFQLPVRERANSASG